MHLSEWRERVGMKQDEFGQRLTPPVTQALVSQWERGLTRMTLDYALQAKVLTKNKVTPEDCADMYDKGKFCNLLKNMG